jgi:hypothetical protein
MGRRKITYHVLKFYEGANVENQYDGFNFSAFKNYINALTNNEKKYAIHDTKFCSISLLEEIDPREYQGRTNCYFGCIKSATHGTNRDLLDSRTNEERDNPKDLEEGEKEENYFIIAFNGNSECEIIFQFAHNGINPSQFRNYLERFITRYLTSIEVERTFNTELGDIIIENPEEIINRLDRIVECKVYIDKDVLGSDFLNLTERTFNVKEDLVVDITANFRQSIVEVARDLVHGIAHNRRISKIWIRGKDNDNNETKFFIESIIKATHINIDLDPQKKSIVRASIKSEMINLI